MKNIGNRAIFVAIPILMIFLLVFNAEYQAAAYQKKLESEDATQLRADYQFEKKEYRAKAGQKITIPVNVTNKGSLTWVYHSEKPINLSYHLYNEKNKLILFDGARTELPFTVKTNQKVEFEATVQAPTEVGVYYVKFDMVCEGMAWFEENGSVTRQIQLIVQ